MDKLIAQWALEGKSDSEIASLVMSHTDTAIEVKSLSVDDIADRIVSVKKTNDITARLAKKQAEADAVVLAAKAKTDVEAQVKSLVDEQMKAFKTHALSTGAGVGSVSVADDWQGDMASMLQLKHKIMHDQASSAEIDELQSLNQKNIRRELEGKHRGALSKKDTDVIIAGTSVAGGVLMPYQFDAQIDMLAVKQSQVLAELKVIQGTEKDLINSVGPLTLSFRAGENTLLPEQRPDFAQQEINPKDAGGILGMSVAAFNGSAYNIVNTMLELYTDAKIKLLETAIFTGSIDVDADPFDGIRFHAGVQP